MDKFLLLLGMDLGQLLGLNSLLRDVFSSFNNSISFNSFKTIELCSFSILFTSFSTSCMVINNPRKIRRVSWYWYQYSFCLCAYVCIEQEDKSTLTTTTSHRIYIYICVCDVFHVFPYERAPAQRHLKVETSSDKQVSSRSTAQSLLFVRSSFVSSSPCRRIISL